MTVAEWLDLWLTEYAQGQLKPRTVVNYEYHIRYNITPYIGKINLRSLDAMTIQKLLGRALSGENRKAPLSPKSVKNLLGVLSSALGQAMKLGYIAQNPCHICKTPKVHKRQITVLGDKDAELLNAIKGNSHEELFIVALFTGLRQSEILGLTWDAVDFEHGRLSVLGQYSHGVFLSTKNGKNRVVCPPQICFEAFKRQKVKQAEYRLLQGQEWNNAHNFVFTKKSGEPLLAVSVYKSLKKVVSEIGLPSMTFHGLRHSFATTALLAGVDVKTVQESLGHYTAAFTLDVYSHVTDQMRQLAAKKMQDYADSLF
jgi:integrase